jgi:alkylation response protein AidB-like acyl-CoA dehydrogenase
MWSSGADTAEYGLCLARVDWDAPKHRGLGMFALRLKSKGVSISPIIPVTGGKAHFFIEYFDDVEVPADYVLGGDCDGWTVAQRLLFHERNATAGVGFGIGMGGGTDVDEDASDRSWQLNIPRLAEKYASLDDPALAGRIADDHIARTVSRQLAERINAGRRAGKLQGPWGSLLKLGMGIDSPTNAETALAVSGADGVIWSGNDDGGEVALNWLRVRGISIAGGSNEIQRNIVSERLLELPREPGEDKDAPFSELLSRRQKKT